MIPYSSTLSVVRASTWRPGLPSRAAYGEIFASGGEGAGAALALSLACDHTRAVKLAAASQGKGMKPEPKIARTAPQAWLWVQDRTALRLTGRPYHPGLCEDLRDGLVHVVADRSEDALFALEEGLRCRDFAFVIGEMAGNPRALDFTASRRLALAVERHGVPLWLVRLDAERDLSAARMRWSMRSVSSPPPRWNAYAPGLPSWHAELFRARTHATGEWILRDDGNSLALERHFADQAATAPDGDLAGTVPDRSLAAG